MNEIKDEEKLKKTREYMKLAASEAEKSKCRKSHHGAIIVKDDKIIGSGYNKPTLEELCYPCVRENIHDNSRVELCSAIHAEWEAILNADRESLKGSTLYHIRAKEGR